jgi:thiol:disulfide interchange protein
MIPTLIGLVILGAALYLVETLIPMSSPIRILIRVIVVVIIVIYLLRMAEQYL